MANVSRPLPKWFAPSLKALIVEVFLLIALGGFVRIMNAGLACPDWPLCFGDYIPDYHPQVYFEFIHRAMAGLVAISAAVLAVTLWLSDRPRAVKLLMAFAMVLLLAQIVFGGLTVLWQLQAGVVATHLGMGTAFFATLLWIYLEVTAAKGRGTEPLTVFAYTRYFLALVYGQILMGGLVASHYAALVCPDFPTCQGQWFPTFQGMIGLHVLHRLMAYGVALSALGNWWVMRRHSNNTRLRTLSRGILAMVLVQVGLGIGNVLLQTPPLIGVLHLATATGILSLALRQCFLARQAEAVVFGRQPLAQ